MANLIKVLQRIYRNKSRFFDYQINQGALSNTDCDDRLALQGKLLANSCKWT
ncbi:MAG: hypothetical protein ACI9FO_001524 [Methylophagaceae bacterium]|jgi:hypothetical protein